MSSVGLDRDGEPHTDVMFGLEENENLHYRLDWR